MRRGFSLVEMLIGIVLLGMVGAIALRVLLHLNWSAAAAGDQGALQASLRGGTLFLMGELRELGGSPGDPDVIAFAPESLTNRAMRGSGLACRITVGAVTVEAATLTGYRAPQPGRDSLLLHQENNPWSPSDDRWIHLPIVGTSAGTCGIDPAITLATQIDTLLYPLHSFAQLAPVRTYEIMQARLYQSAGDYWLGSRSVSAREVIQPVIGPLTSGGLSLAFLDSVSGPAATASSIRSIGLTLRGLTASAIRTRGGYGPASRRTDSLLTRILLRNW
jgi:prepilin-type N-terminal cleavage/methylation domain-containing protein